MEDSIVSQMGSNSIRPSFFASFKALWDATFVGFTPFNAAGPGTNSRLGSAPIITEAGEWAWPWPLSSGETAGSIGAEITGLAGTLVATFVGCDSFVSVAFAVVCGW